MMRWMGFVILSALPLSAQPAPEVLDWVNARAMAQDTVFMFSSDRACDDPALSLRISNVTEAGAQITQHPPQGLAEISFEAVFSPLGMGLVTTSGQIMGLGAAEITGDVLQFDVLGGCAAGPEWWTGCDASALPEGAQVVYSLAPTICGAP